MGNEWAPGSVEPLGPKKGNDVSLNWNVSILCQLILVLTFGVLFVGSLCAEQKLGEVSVVPFADAGKFKMLYDARQRPQSVCLKDHIHIVFNGDAKPSDNGKSSARPMFVSYDPNRRTFSTPAPLGPMSTDHHFSPISCSPLPMRF